MKKLRSSFPQIGTWMSIGSPVISELAAQAGFDWLLFDMEHGCYSETELRHAMQAAERKNCSLIVRVASVEPAMIARLLDWGAHGIMAPHISSASEARRLVQATRYGPRGNRGFSRTVRATRYGLNAPEKMKACDPIVMAQIETLTGVREAENIAKVDGVAVLFVGPADLNWDISMRKVRNPAAKYEASLKSVTQAARKHGKQAGILVRDMADLPILRERGFTTLAIDSDLSILRRAYENMIKTAHTPSIAHVIQ